MLSRSVLLKLSVSLFTTASALPGVAQSTIQWTKNTVVVDGNTAQNALTSVSHECTDHEFGCGPVLLLEDPGARRVPGTVREGPATAIATNAAALVDFVQDGTSTTEINSRSGRHWRRAK